MAPDPKTGTLLCEPAGGSSSTSGVPPGPRTEQLRGRRPPGPRRLPATPLPTSSPFPGGTGGLCPPRGGTPGLGSPAGSWPVVALGLGLRLLGPEASRGDEAWWEAGGPGVLCRAGGAAAGSLPGGTERGTGMAEP